MKIIDKLKNIFFEEVEEQEEIEVPKTYAKKVEVPKRKINFFKDEEEKVRENDLDNFLEEEKETVETQVEEPTEKEEDINKTVPMMFDVDDFLEEENVSYEKESTEEEKKEELIYKREERETKELYAGKKDEYKDNLDTLNYTYSKTTYSEKKEVKGFRPSPIISPIYGILDKNYHKEDIKQKNNYSSSAYYNHKDVSIDDIRKKAYGTLQDDLEVTLFGEPEEVKVDTEPSIDMFDELLDDSNSVKNETVDDSDLFNLIDSMYEKEDDNNGNGK